MNQSFPRILTLLRKERGMSQKDAAGAFGISQALLSHYEKGIRECGLDFVVKAAEFYGVSCDYLLGRSPDRSGALLQVDDLPGNEDTREGSRFSGSVLSTLNKKLIANSQNILFDLLARVGSKELTTESTNYVNLCVYKVFRYVYSLGEKNPQGIFSVDRNTFAEQVSAAMMLSEAKLKCLSGSLPAENVTLIKDSARLLLSSEILTGTYPAYASSLMNLIRNTETALTGKPKK